MSAEIGNQRFVDRFDGQTLDERWTTALQTGTVTFQMADAIDGGFEILTSLIINHNGFIFFNDIRQYSPTGSVFIAIVTISNVLDSFNLVGLKDVIPGTNDAIFFRNDSGTGVNTEFLTFNNTLGTAIDTGLVSDTNPHRYKGELTSTTAKGFVDGLLRATSTTTLPTVKLQPFFRHGNRSSGVQHRGRISYFEVLNK